MPRKIGFHIYTIRVKQRYQRTSETLSSVLGKFDFLDVVAKGLKGALQEHKTDSHSERMSCMKKVTTIGRAVMGTFYAGHYGETSEIVDSISAEVSHEKTTTEAEMVPCFFRIDVPKDRDEGLLILQRDNRVSSKSVFTSLVSPLITAQDEELRVDVTPLTSSQVFAKLVDEGEVQRLRFIRMAITDDFADSYDKGHQEVDGRMELVVTARRGFSLPFRKRIGEWMRSKKQVKEIFEVPSLDFDTVKADVRIGKTVRTLDFGKKFSTPIVDLTSEVKMGKDGHPTYTSLLSATEKLANDQLSEMYDE